MLKYNTHELIESKMRELLVLGLPTRDSNAVSFWGVPKKHLILIIILYEVQTHLAVTLLSLLCSLVHIQKQQFQMHLSHSSLCSTLCTYKLDSNLKICFAMNISTEF
jgi:hypothetical protein